MKTDGPSGEIVTEIAGSGVILAAYATAKALAESLRVALGTDGYPSRLDEEIVALREEATAHGDDAEAVEAFLADRKNFFPDCTICAGVRLAFDVAFLFERADELEDAVVCLRVRFAFERIRHVGNSSFFDLLFELVEQGVLLKWVVEHDRRLLDHFLKQF